MLVSSWSVSQWGSLRAAGRQFGSSSGHYEQPQPQVSPGKQVQADAEASFDKRDRAAPYAGNYLFIAAGAAGQMAVMRNVFISLAAASAERGPVGAAVRELDTLVRQS